MDGTKDLGKELERRWRAYLRFYPYWLEIIQDEDREAKHQKTVQSKMLSLDCPIGSDANGKILTLKDTIAAPNNKPTNLLQAMVLSTQSTLEEWAKKYCTAKQAGHILRYFGESKTEVEIAEEDGVSQQAVSKSIRAAVKRIREGLTRDGFLDAD